MAASTYMLHDMADLKTKDPFLLALRRARPAAAARARGLTRKSVAPASGVSERHLANLEYGIGNASILVLQQVAQRARLLARRAGRRRDHQLAGVAADPRAAARQSEAELRRARLALADAVRRRRRPARAAGASRWSACAAPASRPSASMLADALDMPFVELSREVERIAGCSIREIHDLYGTNAYRRYERRALDETVRLHPEAVIATPGGIVADPATFNAAARVMPDVWLQASPEEHMSRVAAQGDTRPMAASREAMDDLRRILTGRAAFYAKADAALDTTGQSEDESLRRAAWRLAGDAASARRRNMKQSSYPA